MLNDATVLQPEDCLIAIMVAVSVSDADIDAAELVTLEQIVNHLPVFGTYNTDRMQVVGQVVMDLFGQEDGLDTLFSQVRASLPTKLYETAYALACDVAAADGNLGEVELRMLEEIRHELNIDRLSAAAIERGARARHMTL